LLQGILTVSAAFPCFSLFIVSGREALFNPKKAFKCVAPFFIHRLCRFVIPTRRFCRDSGFAPSPSDAFHLLFPVLSPEMQRFPADNRCRHPRAFPLCRAAAFVYNNTIPPQIQHLSPIVPQKCVGFVCRNVSPSSGLWDYSECIHSLFTLI
jgi:hypothetical protein